MITENQVPSVPGSVQAFHAFAKMGSQDEVVESQNQIMVKFRISDKDREMWPLLKDAQELWLIYSREGK